MPDAVVEAAGEIDTSTCDALKADLYAAIDANPGATITVDLAKVEFMDSTGLGVLVAALKHARTGDGNVVVRSAPPRVQKILTITGLDVVLGASDA